MRVSIIGAGRLGRTLAASLPGSTLCRRGEAIPVAEVYWLAVRDADIPLVRLPPGGVALHSSGALGPEAMAGPRERGVLHPLMTFPGPELGPPRREVYARVEGSPRAMAAAEALAAELGWQSFRFDGDRVRYHAAAVMVSGLAGSLFCAAAEELAAAGGMSAGEARRLLYPLAAESLQRAAEGGPAVLTGPAARGDVATIDEHVKTIGSDQRAAYEVLSALMLRMRRNRESPA
ncbi:MAG: DUF2520 domain-containing protein [Deltaproteobacteria bacterium]|nr:DUF2520 domain-containing protein [Deltaproteobacteria bacterium]